MERSIGWRWWLLVLGWYTVRRENGDGSFAGRATRRCVQTRNSAKLGWRCKLDRRKKNRDWNRRSFKGEASLALVFVVSDRVGMVASTTELMVHLRKLDLTGAIFATDNTILPDSGRPSEKLEGETTIKPRSHVPSRIRE